MGAKPFSFCHKSRVIQTYIQTHRQTDKTVVAIPRLHSMQHGKKTSAIHNYYYYYYNTHTCAQVSGIQ